MTISKKIIITLFSFALFFVLSNLGYLTGGKVAYTVLFDFFGYPQDLYIFLFATAMYASSVLFGFIGVILTFIIMHQIGRRLKIAVGKPTFYGFLLYLLTVLRVIILDNLNKGN